MQLTLHRNPTDEPAFGQVWANSDRRSLWSRVRVDKVDVDSGVCTCTIVSGRHIGDTNVSIPMARLGRLMIDPLLPPEVAAAVAGMGHTLILANKLGWHGRWTCLHCFLAVAVGQVAGMDGPQVVGDATERRCSGPVNTR